ncbi:hypothetical protein [Paenibacillus sp. SYP-B4298]|uniref:hypothetical protein n=1 Tax=Paenibacillus sp. SYP-B4298 TaxID=2996034 RepID=UPI0022DE9728|nr:hypothetical protein [Paenibacillus sp. SYP-B4298]
MALRTYFVIEVSGLPVINKYSHYPSEEEIEAEILNRFPNGFIYDQFSKEKIYPVVQVKKFYELAGEG